MSYFVQKATQNSFKLANTDTINNIIRIGTAPPRFSLVMALVCVQESRVSEIVLPSASPKLKENVSSAPSLAHNSGPDCKCSLRPG